LLGLAFVPLFVAIDAVGNLPIIIARTHHFTPRQRRLTLIEAFFTALVVGLVFMLVGKALLRYLGVTVDDFLIAGGLVLLVLAVRDIAGTGVESEEEPEGERRDAESVGAVPIGTPLLVGPATMATLLLLVDQYGPWVTGLAFLLNLLLAWLFFAQAEHISRFLGRRGLRATSKVMSLLLAAIAVHLIRRGLLAWLGG
jgi:multiple antibiotic resistance protein